MVNLYYTESGVKYKADLFAGCCFFFKVQRMKKGQKRMSIGFANKDKEGEQLENYTKYKLKSSDELVSLLADVDNLFIIACNK